MSQPKIGAGERLEVEAAAWRGKRHATFQQAIEPRRGVEGAVAVLLDNDRSFADLGSSRSLGRGSRRSPLSTVLQRLKQGFCLLEVRRIKPCGKPAVDRGEEVVSFGALALLPQARQAHGGAQLQ
jgi:hypothetical protein